MPLPYHLIDGYNLLHAAGLARASYGPGDLERARTALLIKLADGLDDAERPRATVVFDAADPPPDADRSFRFREVAVLFAVEEGEADALIETLIRRHPSPRQLRVVSDDVRIQRAAKRRGAQAVKSEPFLRRLRRRTGPIQPSSPKGSIASGEHKGAVGDWLEFFGVSAGEVAVSVPSSPPIRRNEPAGRPVEPKTGDVKNPRSVSPSHDRGKSKSTRRDTVPAVDEEQGETGEEFGFWQRRIDELLRDVDRRSETS